MYLILVCWYWDVTSWTGRMDGQRLRSQDVGMHLEQNAQSQLHHLLLSWCCLHASRNYLIFLPKNLQQVSFKLHIISFLKDSITSFTGILPRYN